MSRPEQASSWLAGLVCLTSLVPQASDHDAIRQEWHIRALALDSERIELAHQDVWTERLAVLEALRRRLELGQARELQVGGVQKLRERLLDEAPNVRAAAIACLGVAQFEDWDAQSIEKLSRDPLPEVRVELCRAVSATVWLRHLDRLLPLTRSGELEVRRAARVALWALDLNEPAVLCAQTELLDFVLREEGSEDYLIELESWARVPRSESTPVPLNVQGLGESRADAARRALSVALTLGPVDAAQLALLARNWVEPLSSSAAGPGDKHRIQRELLLGAARRLGEPLALELLSALQEAARAERTLEREAALEDLFEGLLAAKDATWLLPRLLELELSDEDLAAFWLLADMGPARWQEVAFEPWLATTRSPEFRSQVADSLARAFTRTGADSLRTELLALLKDGQKEVRDLAFNALCNSPAELSTEGEAQLFEAWSQFAELERFNRLKQLPRSQSLSAFRDTLLRLGEDREQRRNWPSIVELLSKFAGDQECAARLGAWLAEDIGSLSIATNDFARAEYAARGEVRALHDCVGSGAVPTLRLALEQVLNQSVEVAKACASALGRSPEGLAELGLFLGENIPTRIRVEAALALSSRGELEEATPAAEVLLSRYATCDGELQSRILAVFARLDLERVREFALEQWAVDETPVELLPLVLDVLRARYERNRSAANLADLVHCVESRRGGEGARIAIDVLGRTRDERVRPLLEARLTLGKAKLGSERDELLMALARCAPTSALLWRELWREPLLSAEWRLTRRFRGESSAAIAFSFRGELEAMQSVAEAGGWREDETPLFERLDGRLALALAEACRTGGDAEHAELLERVALVALAGESPDEKARFAALRARARLWRAAELAGRDFETAHFSGRLLQDWIAGQISNRDLDTLFGTEEPDAGVAPVERLAASYRRARAALATEVDRR